MLANLETELPHRQIHWILKSSMPHYHQGRTAISIDIGREHACSILDDNSSVCWGNNTDGQIGDGTTITRLTPTYVTFPGNHFSEISTGKVCTPAVSHPMHHCTAGVVIRKANLGWAPMTV